MNKKVFIEVDLGKRAVEKTDVTIYVDSKLIESYYNKSYNDLPQLAHELRVTYQDSEIEAWCMGEDCAGRVHRWKIDV